MTDPPREGVDYMIDLYGVAGVAASAPPEEIKAALRERATEYHPDPQQTRAPEFQARAEHMMRIITRARGILLDGEKRAAYDQLMAEWDGPISTDGVPVRTLGRRFQSDLAGKTSEEIEADFAASQERVDLLSGHSASRLSLFERMISEAGDEAPEELRHEYDQALLARDTSLAIQQQARLQLLGVPVADEQDYSIGYDHGKDIAFQIAAARDAQEQHLHAASIGNFATRLAILAGESEPERPAGIQDTTPVLAAAMELPPYFDSQTARTKELARQREEVLAQRLALLKITYPEEELQTVQHEQFFVGLGRNEQTVWMAMRYNPDTKAVDNFESDPVLLAKLQAGDFAAVIEADYNVFHFSALEQIEPLTQLENVIVRHLAKFSTDNP